MIVSATELAKDSNGVLDSVIRGGETAQVHASRQDRR